MTREEARGAHLKARARYDAHRKRLKEAKLVIARGVERFGGDKSMVIRGVVGTLRLEIEGSDAIFALAEVVRRGLDSNRGPS